jgi:hypothetical protein
VALLILAHGSVLGVLVVWLGSLTLLSMAIAIAVWSLSYPRPLTAPKGCVAPVLIGLIVVLLNYGAAAIWWWNDWTLLGPLEGDTTLVHLGCALGLRGTLFGALYVLSRRHQVRTATSRLGPRA